MENVLYFLTVVPIGLTILGIAFRYDERHVEVGSDLFVLPKKD